MRFATTLSVATTIALLSVSAGATDIISHSENAHTLSITMADGTTAMVDVAAKGEVLDVCEGCTISMENGTEAEGTSVQAEKGDLVVLTAEDKLQINAD
ncbi:MAG: hypothetical protein OEX17_00870 [Rhodospirillaceae bacterium]|nr:hypothetical protein [Rhodospirillaceae bacterium]